MKYVKIRAKNYNDALMQLRMKHGDEAIPISHKYVKEGGLFNSRLFGKDMVELTAAIQEKSIKRLKKEAEKTSNFDVRVDNDISKDLFNSSVETTIIRDSKDPHLSRTAGKKNNGAAIELTSKEFSDLKKFERDYYDLKKQYESLIEKQSEANNFVSETGNETEVSELKPFAEILKNNDFDSDECNNIIDEVKNSISKTDLSDKVKIEKSLKELLKSRIVTSGPISVGNQKKIVMFLGPTGVGKTTSLAKLGALFALREGKSVAFITIDTYRIAATEQLKKYAEIMKIPVHVVNEQKELKSVINKIKAEIILIDTSGRNHKNLIKISEIKSYADQIDYDFEKILCVSATTKKSDVDNIFKSFDKIEFDSVLITKADETSFVGNIVNVADKYNKPISYVANGQEVPNDIFIAEPEKIADLMVSEFHP